MKLKELGPGDGARPKFYYVDPPLEFMSSQTSINYNYLSKSLPKTMKTRMHSNRMYTVRRSGHLGGRCSAQRGCLPGGVCLGGI